MSHLRRIRRGPPICPSATVAFVHLAISRSAERRVSVPSERNFTLRSIRASKDLGGPLRPGASGGLRCRKLETRMGNGCRRRRTRRSGGQRQRGPVLREVRRRRIWRATRHRVHRPTSVPDGEEAGHHEMALQRVSSPPIPGLPAGYDCRFTARGGEGEGEVRTVSVGMRFPDRNVGVRPLHEVEEPADHPVSSVWWTRLACRAGYGGVQVPEGAVSLAGVAGLAGAGGRRAGWLAVRRNPWPGARFSTNSPRGTRRPARAARRSAGCRSAAPGAPGRDHRPVVAEHLSTPGMRGGEAARHRLGALAGRLAAASIVAVRPIVRIVRRDVDRLM